MWTDQGHTSSHTSSPHFVGYTSSTRFVDPSSGANRCIPAMGVGYTGTTGFRRRQPKLGRHFTAATGLASIEKHDGMLPQSLGGAVVARSSALSLSKGARIHPAAERRDYSSACETDALRRGAGV